MPAAALLADQIKSLQTEELRPILSAIFQEMEAGQVPNRSPPILENTSLTQAHELSSVLHSLIKEGALGPIFQNCQFSMGRWLRERHPLNNGLMNYSPDGRDSKITEGG